MSIAARRDPDGVLRPPHHAEAAAFGVRLGAVRRAAGASQRWLAAASGVPLPTLRKYEQGRRVRVPFAAVLAIADALGVGVGAFDTRDGAGAGGEAAPVPAPAEATPAEADHLRAAPEMTGAAVEVAFGRKPAGPAELDALVAYNALLNALGADGPGAATLWRLDAAPARLADAVAAEGLGAVVAAYRVEVGRVGYLVGRGRAAYSWAHVLA